MKSCRYCCLLFLLAALSCAVGCTSSPRETWESLKGDGFPGWNDAGVRGNKDAKASGFFTDRRSEQIEKDLGGNF